MLCGASGGAQVLEPEDIDSRTWVNDELRFTVFAIEEGEQWPPIARGGCPAGTVVLRAPAGCHGRVPAA